MTTASTAIATHQSKPVRRSGWFSMLTGRSTESADLRDRQREREIDAQALPGIEALLLTDISPVSFPFERCWDMRRG